jgi:mono/diheme cytochrome c family protein
MSRADRVTAIIGAALLVMAAAARADAQKIKREPVREVAPISGAATFKAYCTVCHGIGAKGDGPAAKALKVPPADLTRIAKRHEGRFPFEATRAIIRGDAEYDAHGTREMPMWGPVFRSIDDTASVDLRVNNLVRYLEAIQEK